MKPNIFFTSDQHFGHANIIKFCNRPFDSVWHMNETLIKNHNEMVGPDDWVYMLGDFSFRSADDPRKIFDRLNGKKILIKGNHDKGQTLRLPWQAVHDVLHLRLRSISGWQDDSREFFLSHYPHRAWNKSCHGVPHLFGHTHGKLGPRGKSFDVGVDVEANNYAPVSLQEVLMRLDELPTSSLRSRRPE